ncbi:MAG: hypothetical protein U0931_00230 [Vulcanimicrobiota bacterium]
MFGFLSKPPRVPLETQLERLRACGIELRPGVELSDLYAFHSREKLEASPYKLLIDSLATELEREPYTAKSDRLWICDLERIEDHGDYRSILERLDSMHGGPPLLSDIQDFVDVEAGQARVSFTYEGQSHCWQLKVDNDWADPAVFEKFQALLPAGQRLYVNTGDYGQSVLLACFTPGQYRAYQELKAVALKPL